MNTWTYEDAMVFESEVRDSINAAAYFNSYPKYDDIKKEGESDEFCDSFFEEF